MVLHSLLEGLHAHNAYVTLGFVDTEKQAVWMDRRQREYRADSLDEDFIRQALANKNAVSETRWDETHGMHVNYYAVPVHASGTDNIKGVFFAADPEREMRTIIDNSLYAGQGLAHIIDRNGKFIVKSQNPLSLARGDSVFSESGPNYLRMRQSLLASLAAGKTGNMSVPVNGENRLIAYTPLNINDWYLLYAVPESMVSAGLKTVTLGAVTVIFVGMIVFASLILLIRQVNSRARRALESIAFVDPVTGGRNYNKFLLDAEVALRKAGRAGYAICYSDIEGFRYINDLFGRAASDQLLRYWSNFMQEITREGELFCRMGGDLFVALLRYQSKQEIEKRLKSIAHRLAVYPETLSRGYTVTLHSGIYLMEEAEAITLSLSDMLDRAISTQKAVRTAGGGKRLGFYSHKMREQKLWEAESRMDISLENHEFHIYLQPKIDIQHGDRIMGAEALVRWVLPGKGLVPPARFIGLFELSNWTGLFLKPRAATIGKAF